MTLVPKTIIDATNNITIAPSTRHLFAANNTEIETTGEVVLPLKLNRRCIRTRASVTPDVDEVMLGVGWLHEHKCVWDFAKRQIYCMLTDARLSQYLRDIQYAVDARFYKMMRYCLQDSRLA